MQYFLTVHAYDCLDQVVHTAQIRQYADYENGPSETVLLQAGSFAGEGKDSPRDWLEDVLIGILETL